MLKKIRMPDGKSYSFEELSSYPDELPAPWAYFKYVFDRRSDLEPHATDFLQGMRKTYLEKTRDYTADLESGTMNISGTIAHAVLDPKEHSETGFTYRGVKMRPDLLEEHRGELILIDHKHQGSYAIAKALGIQKREAPKTDEHGNAMYYKSGKKAGQAMTETTFIQGEKDLGRYQYQLNAYRVAMNSFLRGEITLDDGTDVHGSAYKQWAGREVARIKVFFIPKDAGMMSAKMNGITQRMYFEEIPILPDEEINRWLDHNRNKLAGHMKSETPPDPCSKEEAWGGKMCESFCPVKEFCVALGDNPYIGTANLF